ncbi:major facilitator superfamily domain-containing protein [Scleroderma citrinum]
MEEFKQLDQDGFSTEQERTLEGVVWRKLDRRILPICTMFYLLSFLDRGNIANARVAGMQTALDLSNYQYSIALTLTYIPYIAAELPSNLVLRYVGPNLMLPAMVTAWGIICTMQGLVHDYAGLLACRFCLGLVEGGLFPGLVLYLSLFYPRERLQIRIATFFASASLSGAFSGLFAAAITQMDGVGGKPGWAWIFILEGLFTLLFGIISFFGLPRSPVDIQFLVNEERSYVIQKLKRAGAISEDDKKDDFSWMEVVKSAQSPQVWLVSVISFLNGTLLYSIAYFEPTIVQGLGYTGNRAQLMSVPPFAIAFCFSMVSALVSDRYSCRGLTVIIFSTFSTIGYSMFHGDTSHQIRYLSLFFSTTGCYGGGPSVIAWVANNSAPHARRATSVAIAFILGNSGGILATWLLGSLSPAPNYTKATVTFITMSVASVALSTTSLCYLQRQNRMKAEQRLASVRDDEPEHLGDRSAWFVYSL